MAKSIAVVGGGAAGLAAAIAAGRALRAAGAGDARVAIYEDDERVGRSILATGNGRCNFSNAQIDAALYRNGDFVARTLAALEDLGGVCDALRAMGAPVDGEAGAEAAAVASATAASGMNAVLRFFASCGLARREEGQGRLYPVTNKASTVLDVLRAAAHACEVEERCGNAVRAIEPPREPGGRFTLRMADGAFERADAVVVAVGGRYGVALLPDGIETEPFAPVLGPLKTDTALVRALDNIRVRCTVALRRGGARDGRIVACESGEVLFRKYGVSGIAVFNLSRRAKPGDELVIDLLGDPGMLGGGHAGELAPASRDRAAAEEGASASGGLRAACDEGRAAGEGMRAAGDDGRALGFGGASGSCDSVGAVGETSETAAAELLMRRRDTLAASGLAQTCGEVLRGLLLPLVGEAVCKAAGVALDAAPTDDALACIAAAASGLVLRVEGIGDARQCQVHRGGVRAGAVDPATMAARAVPSLYLAGEMIDVDAPCGGYNLHWAWASGLVAGASAARAVR